jgi:hypothetical protein
MKSIAVRRFTLATFLAIALIALPQTANAAPTAGGFTYTVTAAPTEFDSGVLPKGQACPGFDLHVVGTDGQAQILTISRAGETVREIEGGMGWNLTYTNVQTGKSVFFPSDYYLRDTVTHKNGMRTVTNVGSFAIIMFPTDVPAGPSTTQYKGLVVYSATPTNDFTILRTKAASTDVCAMLAG